MNRRPCPADGTTARRAGRSLQATLRPGGTAGDRPAKSIDGRGALPASTTKASGFRLEALGGRVTLICCRRSRLQGASRRCRLTCRPVLRSQHHVELNAVLSRRECRNARSRPLCRQSCNSLHPGNHIPLPVQFSRERPCTAGVNWTFRRRDEGHIRALPASIQDEPLKQRHPETGSGERPDVIKVTGMSNCRDGVIE